MPRTLAQNAQYIAETIKPAIKSAIEAQGVTVPSTDSFLDYADRIGEIEGGGSGYQLKDLPTGSISTVNDAAELPLNALKVSVEAQQDLHGYDHPWVGGAGKNKLPLVLADIKANNTEGTWNGNVYTNKGITYTFLVDNANNVTGLNISGTAEAGGAGLDFIKNASYPFNGTYIISGEDGFGYPVATYDINFADSSYNTLVYSSDVEKAISSNLTKYGLFIWQGVTVNKTIYPMIRLSTESDASFAPYSNICPISGWDSGEITVVGKNFAKYWKNGYINSSGQFVVDEYNATTYPIKLKNGETYTLRMNSDTVASFNGSFFENFDGINLTGFIKRLKEVTDTTREFTFTAESDSYFVCSGNVNMITPTEENFTTLWKIQLELGNQATTYEPYQSKQYTLNFPTAIYGAEWDVVNGEMKQTDGYIASYNGETLPSTWISDRDVYASGTTPTIGAEVVYKLATPTTIDLSPLSIRLLENTNHIYTDCGEVLEGEYFVGSSGAYDLYDYIQTDGTQAIDLGVKVNSGDVINCIYTPLTGMTNWNWLWIAEDTNTGKFSGVVFMSSSQMADYDYSVETNRRNWVANQINTSNFTASNNINANIKFSDGAIVKLYSFSINGDDYLPCKRRSDGKFGLYDVKNSTFLTDSASGNAFVGGNNLGVRIG